MSCETIWIKKNHQNNYVISSDNAYSKFMGLFSSKEGFKEGASFEMFPDSSTYYKNCKNWINTTTNLPIGKIINAIIDTIVSPFYEIDNGIEKLIIYFINMENVIDKKAIKTIKNKIGKSKINTNYFDFASKWTADMPSYFSKEVTSVANDINNTVKNIDLSKLAKNEMVNQVKNQALNVFDNANNSLKSANSSIAKKSNQFINSAQKIEFFSPNTQEPDVVDESASSEYIVLPPETPGPEPPISYKYSSLQSFLNVYQSKIDSFVENHSWIENYDLYNNFAQYYCQKFNEFETANCSYTTSDLINFNKEIDLSLYEIDKSEFNFGNPVLLPVLQNIEFTCFPDPNPLSIDELLDTIDNTIINENTQTPIPKKPAKKKRPPIDPTIKKDAQLIKEFIYQLLLLPVYFFISYNLYYVIYFRKKNKIVEGKLTELSCHEIEYPNWDWIFNNKYTGFITEFMFKPTQMFMVLLNCFKFDEFNYAFNKVLPYITFMLVFLIVMWGVFNHLPKLWKIIIGLYQFKIDAGVYSYCSGVIWLFFAISLIKGFVEKVVDEGMSMATGKSMVPPTPYTIAAKVLLFIVYWIFKGFVTASIIPFSACIFIIYLFMVLFGYCGIDNIKYINQYLYFKLFDKKNIPVDIFDEKQSENAGHGYKLYQTIAKIMNRFIFYIREPFKYIFYFMFEIVLLLLFESFKNKTDALLKSVKSKKIKIVLLVITYVIRILISIWVVIKGVKYKAFADEKDYEEIYEKIKEPDPECEVANFINVKSFFSSLTTQIKNLFDFDKSVEKFKDKFVKGVTDNPLLSKMGVDPDMITDAVENTDKTKLQDNLKMSGITDVSKIENIESESDISKLVSNPIVSDILGNSGVDPSVVKNVADGDFSKLEIKNDISNLKEDVSHLKEDVSHLKENSSNNITDALTTGLNEISKKTDINSNINDVMSNGLDQVSKIANDNEAVSKVKDTITNEVSKIANGNEVVSKIKDAAASSIGNISNVKDKVKNAISSNSSNLKNIASNALNFFKKK